MSYESERRDKWEGYNKIGIRSVWPVGNYPYGWFKKLLNNVPDIIMDHVKFVFIDRKRALITTEPYNITDEQIKQLLKAGEENGFTVSFNDRFKNHLADTGHCIEITPLKWKHNAELLERRFNINFKK